MKYFYLFIAFTVLFPNIISAQVFDELSAEEIASLYDYRAYTGEDGYNSYQKKETFIDEYNIMRYRITTLYENMDINQAYASYIANSKGIHFENNNGIADHCKITKWPAQLPKEDKVLNWHYDYDLACDGVQKNERWLDNTLNYKYENPKQVTVKYHAFGTEYYYPKATDLILEFKQEAKGTYLTITSKALPVSFDCKKAGNATEKAICEAAEKGNFNEDAKLNYLYKGLYRELIDDNSNKAIENLKSSQIAWIKKRNQCKGDINCIKEAYISRYNELNAQWKQKYKDIYSMLNNCTYLHTTNWDGTLSDTEYSMFHKCQFKGDIFKAYEAVAAKYSNIKKYFAGLEQIKQKKDIYNEVNDPSGGIYYVKYRWKNDALEFTIAYEYSGTVYTFTPKDNVIDIIVYHYDIP